MKNIIFFFIVLSPFILSAQKKDCKYEKNEIDEFEKILVKVTKEETVRKGIGYPVVRFALAKVGDNYAVIMFLSNGKPLCFTSDSELLLLKSNDEVVRLSFGQNGVECLNLVYVPGAGITQYTNQLKFLVSETDLISLQSDQIKKIRIVASGEIIEVDLTKGNTTKEAGMTYFIRNVKCVLGGG